MGTFLEERRNGDTQTHTEGRAGEYTQEDGRVVGVTCPQAKN